MSRLGTGLSRLLSYMLIAGLVLAGIGCLAAIALAGAALFDPSVLAEGNGFRLNGMPAYMARPDGALTVASIMLAACAFGAAMIWQLLGLLRSAAAGEPFVTANVRRLRVIAALFATVLILQLGTVLLPDTVQDMFNLRRARLDLGAVFSTMAALVLAEVFKVGVALREEAEGTI